jgi:hypothetical protein
MHWRLVDIQIRLVFPRARPVVKCGCLKECYAATLQVKQLRKALPSTTTDKDLRGAGYYVSERYLPRRSASKIALPLPCLAATAQKLTHLLLVCD